MREELIGNAVEFLLDSRVASSTEDKKRKFLVQKGLSDMEINEAFARVNQSFPQQMEINGNNPQQQVVQVRPMEIPWKTLGFVIVLCVAIGNSLQSLIVKYVVPFWFGAKEKKATDIQIEELKAQLTVTTEKAKTQIQEIQESLIVVKRFISNQQENIRMVKTEKEQEDIKISIIQDEVNSITHMLPQLINPIVEKRNDEPKKTDEVTTKAKEPTVPWKRKDLSESSKKPDWLNSQQPMRLSFLDEDAKKKEEAEKKKETDEKEENENQEVDQKEDNGNEKKESEDIKEERIIKETNDNNDENVIAEEQPAKEDSNIDNSNTQ
jgi:hypothetical protein